MHERRLEGLCRVPPGYRTATSSLIRWTDGAFSFKCPDGQTKLRWRPEGCQAQGILKGEIDQLNRLLGEGARSEGDLFLRHRGHCLEPPPLSTLRRALRPRRLSLRTSPYRAALHESCAHNRLR